MALETASFVANLVSTNPDGGDARSTADDHLRLIKAALTRTFPKLDSAVSLSAAQVMFMNDLSASVQSQLNTLRDGSATANAALYANSASFATNAGYAQSASFAAVANRALSTDSASFATLAATATNAGYAQSASFAAVANRALNADSASFATAATNATNATFATTCTSASSAALLSGFSADTAENASTIAKRDSSGDLTARYMRQTSGLDNQSVGHIACMTNLDGYWRPMTPAQLGSYLEARNITNKSGTAKTLASGVGPPSLTGSTNGDLWYYY